MHVKGYSAYCYIEKQKQALIWMKKLIITKRRVFFHNIELIGGDLFLVQLVPVGYAIGISETNKFQFRR